MNKKEQVYARQDQLTEAMLEKDESALRELLHPDVSVFGSAIHEHEKGLENVIDYYLQSLGLLPEDKRIDLKWRDFTDLGDQALVEQEFEIHFTIENKDVTLLTLRQSALWTPVPAGTTNETRWMLLHDHSSMPDHLGAIETISTDELLEQNLNLEFDTDKLRTKLEQALSELNRARKQLLKQEKLAAVGQLAAGIAHEIKNPLNFVNNFSEVIEELVEEAREELLRKAKDRRRMNSNSPHQPAESADPESLQEKRGVSGKDGSFESENVSEEDQDTDFLLNILNDIEANLKKVREHGNRADSIVKSMLMHSRGKSGKPVPSDLNKLLDEHLKLAYHGMRATNTSFNIDIHTDFDNSLPEMNLIPQDLSRAFLNILNNAMYAAYDYSTQQPGRKPEITVSTALNNNTAVIRIRDNGNGIPEENREQIFKPFFSTKPAGIGTGLGLSMTSDIVKMHNGSIKVDSVKNQFTEFIITIPIDKSKS